MRPLDHILGCYEIVKTDFVRGHGCTLYDARGREYVDFEAGVWCTVLGHRHERIDQVMREQSAQIMHLGYRYTSDLAEEAAIAVLTTLALPDGRCTFLSSGSEAVEFAVQTARRVTGQPLLLTLADSYLAAYGSASRKSPQEWVCLDWSPCAACPQNDQCDPHCSRLGEIPFESIGGLVFEPGNASGLVRFPPMALVQTLAARIKQHGGLLVVDEVTTGLGRTGAWYGFQHYGLRPDVVALGKGLGNGYPVSGIAMTREIADRLEDSAFRYAQSHQNDPLGCAVAREIIAVIQKDGLVERSDQVGACFRRDLQQLAERHEIVRQVRGRGLMIALDLEGSQGQSPASVVYRELLERGFLVGYNPSASLLRFYPALTIGEEDIAHLLESLEHILEHL